MRLLWLPDALRGAGLTVVEMDGWKTSGAQLKAVEGVVIHHTATGPRTKDDAVERLLRNGRPDLKGPLCQLGLRRDGTWVVVASGKANHNGYGEWGNQSIGVEAYNDGVGEAWPDVQYRSYVAGVRALLAHLRLPATKAKGHKETDPGRKIDPTFNMLRFRADLADSPAPLPPIEEDDMPTIITYSGGKAALLVDGKLMLLDKADRDAWAGAGAKSVPADDDHWARLKRTLGEPVG